MMYKIKQYALPAGIIVVLIATAALFYVNNRDGQVNKEAGDSSETTKSTNDQGQKSDAKKSNDQSAAADSSRKVEESKQGFTYYAETGDSYTLLARHAVQSLSSDLSKAQRIAAETFLTQQAGAPELEVAEKVTLSKDAVKSAIQKAEGLSSAELAAWQAYVPLVDFS